MSRTDRDGRTVLARLKELREYTEVLGQMAEDLRRFGALSILLVALHQVVALLR